jgi:hypothetical protein
MQLSFIMKYKAYLTFTLLIASQILLLFKTWQLGNGDFTGYIIETAILVTLSFLFLKRFLWAKWMLMIFLVLLFTVSLIGAFQHDDFIFYLIALLQALTIYQLYRTKIFKDPSHKSS